MRSDIIYKNNKMKTIKIRKFKKRPLSNCNFINLFFANQK